MVFVNNSPAVQEPLQEACEGPSGREETKTTHPSFAQITVSRVSGRANLYGSDFTHNGYVQLEIKQSELRRNLSNDWHFPRGEIIHIALSEAQWASLVSSFNVGAGVPCTIMWQQGVGYVPRLPDPKSRVDQFADEMQEDFTEAIASLDELANNIEAVGLSRKKTDALLAGVQTARAKLTSSAPFVADQFGEHMENETERAKVEIHGYATALFQRAGVTALAGDGPLTLDKDVPHRLEDKTGD